MLPMESIANPCWNPPDKQVITGEKFESGLNAGVQTQMGSSYRCCVEIQIGKIVCGWLNAPLLVTV
jgi:hypothetical protein